MPSGRDPQQDWDDLSQAAGGDERAFARLVRRHERRLYRLSWRLLGDAARAEEAVQDVFLKLYLKAATFEPRGQLYSLLYRMTTNHCLNRLRRRRLVRLLSLSEGSDESGELDLVDPRPSPGVRQESVERWRQTRRWISRLPAGQRAVLVLVKIEGLSYQEAAAALGVTLGAVESRLFRAMRALERLSRRRERESDEWAQEAGVAAGSSGRTGASADTTGPRPTRSEEGRMQPDGEEQ